MPFQIFIITVWKQRNEKLQKNFKKTSSVDSEIQNDDTTLDENLQKMILSRPVDEKNFSDIMVTALGLVIL